LSFLENYAEILHLRLLPRSTPLPVLTRFFALHPEPKDRSLTLLSRWTWRALLGKALFDERTLLRRAVSAIVKDDEEGSIQSLLKLVPKQAPPELILPAQFDARSADSRIALLGLTSLKPLDIYDGNPIDVAALIEEDEIGAFRKIIPISKSLGRSPANRILAPGNGTARREIIEQLDSVWKTEEINTKIWHSHAITELALTALHENRIDDFFEERKTVLENIIRECSNRLAAWEQNDRPSIDYLINQPDETE
jgi:hypothetical protein